jgi:hypothetical protein
LPSIKVPYMEQKQDVYLITMLGTVDNKHEGMNYETNRC